NRVHDHKKSPNIVYILDVDGGGHYGAGEQFPPTVISNKLYCAPELITKSWRSIWEDQSKPFNLKVQPDLWSLAVLIFLILVDSQSPFISYPPQAFTSKFGKEYSPYPKNFFVGSGQWPQEWQRRYMRTRNIDDSIIELLTAVFNEPRDVFSHTEPRPSADTWYREISRLIQLPKSVQPPKSVVQPWPGPLQPTPLDIAQAASDAEIIPWPHPPQAAPRSSTGSTSPVPAAASGQKHRKPNWIPIGICLVILIILVLLAIYLHAQGSATTVPQATIGLEVITPSTSFSINVEATDTVNTTGQISTQSNNPDSTKVMIAALSTALTNVQTTRISTGVSSLPSYTYTPQKIPTLKPSPTRTFTSTNIYTSTAIFSKTPTNTLESTSITPVNVALGKPVTIITNGLDDHREQPPGDGARAITDGSLKYVPGGSTAPDSAERGVIGFADNNYNQLMVVTVTIDLEGSFRIFKIRYNPGNVMHGDTWNADTMTSPFGTTATIPGGSYRGSWTEQIGDIVANDITIVFSKTRTSYATDWMFIGEVEIYGIPVTTAALPTSPETPKVSIVTFVPSITTTSLSTMTNTPSPTHAISPPVARQSATLVYNCVGTVAQQFIGVWPQLKNILGCPGHLTNTTQFAYQDFQHGKLIWRGLELDSNNVVPDTDGTALALYDDGTWQLIQGPKFNEGDPTYSCPEVGSPQSPLTPKRGFGKLLCNLPDVRDKLGPAITSEQGYPTSFVQQYDNGFLIHYHMSSNIWQTIAFLYGQDQQSGTWKRP
ncbi:MAG: hypothetical protein ACYDBJ_20865, partial [Aggregatilineales bacterium]